MDFKRLEPDFSICKLEQGTEIPWGLPYIFFAQSEQERSLLCPTPLLPQKSLQRNDGWRGFRIEGVLDFTMVGVLAAVSGILAEGGIQILAVSTFNTDYFFVKQENLEKAVQALELAGHRFIE